MMVKEVIEVLTVNTTTDRHWVADSQVMTWPALLSFSSTLVSDVYHHNQVGKHDRGLNTSLFVESTHRQAISIQTALLSSSPTGIYKHKNQGDAFML